MSRASAARAWARHACISMANTGALVGQRVPGEGTAGDLFMRLQFPLHSGRIAAVPGLIVVTLLDVAITALSVTGVVLWLTLR